MSADGQTAAEPIEAAAGQTGVGAASAARSAVDGGAATGRPMLQCPHCRSPGIGRWGRSGGGRQRWQCKACERTFSSSTGTILAGLHQPDKLAAVLEDMLARVPRSCRALAGVLGVDKTTVWRWRNRLGAGLAVLAAAPSDGRPSMLETTVRESRKASREWVNHARDPERHPAPVRHRWIDYRRLQLPLPTPMTPYRIVIRLAADDAGGCRAELPPDRSGWTTPSRAGRAAEPCAGRLHAVDRPARRSCGCRTTPGKPDCATRRVGARGRLGPLRAAAPADGLLESLQAFLRPFRGPATHHLRGYVAWFVVRTAPGCDGEVGQLRRQLFGIDPTRCGDMREAPVGGALEAA